MKQEPKVTEFFNPECKKLPVNGTAVKSGVSRNGIMYLPEELKKFTKTLQGVSIIKDHYATVDNAVGVVEKTRFVEGGLVMYEGWIKDHMLNEKVKDGRVKHVSIGALVEKLVKEDEDSDVLIAKGMHGVELSVVIVPGVPGATMQQSLKMHEKAKTTKEKNKIPPIFENVNTFECLGETKEEVKEDIKMTNQEVKEQAELSEEEQSEEQPQEQPEEQPEKQTEEKVDLQEEINKEVNRKMEQKESKELEASLNATKEDLASKESLLAEKESENAKLKEELAAVAKARKEALVEQYKKLAETKKVEAKDVSELTEDTIKLLCEQLESIKVAETVVEDATKGKVGAPEVSEEELDDSLLVEKSKFGNGFALFREDYNSDRFNRLKR
jgi:hypothetical protein